MLTGIKGSLCPHPLRRIGYRDPVTKKHYVFITNNFKLAAKTIADIYKERRQIEIFFRILKSGCRIEELQLEKLERLEPALAFYMIIAWRVLFLTMLGRECPEMPCDVVFDEAENRLHVQKALMALTM